MHAIELSMMRDQNVSRLSAVVTAPHRKRHQTDHKVIESVQESRSANSAHQLASIMEFDVAITVVDDDDDEGDIAW
jgi:hypothetical protein